MCTVRYYRRSYERIREYTRIYANVCFTLRTILIDIQSVSVRMRSSHCYVSRDNVFNCLSADKTSDKKYVLYCVYPSRRICE